MPPDQSYWGAVGRATLGGTLGGAAGGFLFRALAPSLGLMTRNAERQMQTAGLDCSIGAGSRATSYAGHASLGGLGGGVGYGLGTLAAGGELNFNEFLAATVNGAMGGVASFRGMRTCFARGTPVRTPGGSTRIEDLKAGDLVLSRDEHDPDGPVVAKRVEEVFERNGLIRE